SAGARIFWLPVALSLSTSAQWACGNVQYDTYLYSGGFSFTSTVCAPASLAVIPSTAKPATPIITLHTDLFMLPPLPLLTSTCGLCQSSLHRFAELQDELIGVSANRLVEH